MNNKPNQPGMMTINQKVAERLLAPQTKELLHQLYNTRAEFAITMRQMLETGVVAAEMHTGLFRQWMKLEEVIQNLILDAVEEGKS